MKSNVVKSILLTGLGMMVVNCGGIQIDVSKKGKDSSLAAASANKTQNNSTSHYLDDLDQLRSIATSVILNELASGEFKAKIRKSVRDMKKLLTEKAKGNLSYDESFYTDPTKKCLVGKYNLNMLEENEYFGMVLKAVTLASISAESAKILNSNLSSELTTIANLILAEVGLIVEGDVDVSEENGVITTTGNTTIKLVVLEDDSEELQFADENESLNISYIRSIAQDDTGSFEAVLSVNEATQDSNEEYEMNMTVSKSLDNDIPIHDATVFIKKVGDDPKYARNLKFVEIEGKEDQFTLIDTVDYQLDGEREFTTELNLKDGSVCKLSDTNDNTDEGKDDDNTDEGKDDDNTDEGKDDDNTDEGKDDDNTDEGKDDDNTDEGKDDDPSQSDTPSQS